MPEPLSPDERAWQEKYASLATGELTTARATAKEWTGSISAITGLLAIVSLIKGRENIEDLTDRWSTTTYIALIAALLLALAAIVLGALAAQGALTSLGNQPGRWRSFLAARASANPGPYDANWEGVRDFTHNEAKITRTLLGWSRVLAIAAALLLIFAVAATWMAPTDEKRTPVTVLVVRKNGSFACGDLAKSSLPGVIFVTEKKGQPAIQIRADKVLTLSSAQNCP